MTTAHTPAPWKFEKSVTGNYTGFDINCAAPGNSKWIASVHSAHNITGNEPAELSAKKAQEIANAEANARLISAAPDLLAALDLIAKFYEQNIEATAHEQASRLYEARCVARAAIAKATATGEAK